MSFVHDYMDLGGSAKQEARAEEHTKDDVQDVRAENCSCIFCIAVIPAQAGIQ
jgi:hypothetical protein